MTSQTTLKPCPFCGGEARKIGGCVQCKSCGAQGPYDDTNAWNTRADETRIRKEALEDAAMIVDNYRKPSSLVDRITRDACIETADRIRALKTPPQGTTTKEK